MASDPIVNRLIPLVDGLFDQERLRFSRPLPLAAEAALVLAVSKTCKRSLVWILDGPQSLESGHRDLLSLQPKAHSPLHYFPAWETVPGQDTEPDPAIAGHRLNTLLALQAKPADTPVIATCVQALMQAVASPRELGQQVVTLTLNDETEPGDLATRLADYGYSFEPEVLQKGQAALRGGILDAWPVTETWPLRMEFIGSTIESIRTFDPADQTSVAKVNTASLPPILTHTTATRSALLLDYLSTDTLFVWSDTDSVTERASAYNEIIEESKSQTFAIPFDSLRNRIKRRRESAQLMFDPYGPSGYHELPLDLRPVQGVFDLPAQLLQPDLMERAQQKLLTDLDNYAAKGFQVRLCFDTQGSLDHFTRQQDGTSLVSRLPLRYAPLPSPVAPLGPSLCGRLTLHATPLSSGFISDAAKLVVIAEGNLYGRGKTSLGRYDPLASKTGPSRVSGSRITTLSDMEPGDLVVHVDHGVGRYMGLGEIMVTGQRQEVITVEYADDAKLHIPVSQSHLLSRYVGLARKQIRLHRLGGKRWNNEKDRAEQAIQDLAASLLETQAQRDHLSGFAFPAHTPWQHEFETSFPYRETADQVRVIDEIMRDMLSTHPMDRLICGDAGYGKTEVAMRAAFKTVMATKQVGVLVPTTVLAQQHFETFSERMASYPIRIDMLSRFCSRGERTRTLQGLAEGTVDIVIGTHALIQEGIAFKDLGLVIIDEEQRFGVRHKERLKQVRKLVDVLTLTATPIPRTLYMSMTGARDMSLLQTPPSERMAIQTVVAKNSDKVVREAILRELNREGQVFYLHNRILTIERVKKRLNQLVPEARIEIAHGRMPSGELATVMHRFAEGDFDVLLCTTIIESGLDIPRANTILIDRADRFGIADLYQLRGRVGRSNHKAYAYLLLPQDSRIDSDARQRIGAVRKYSGLSAGFNLALRDLEIRGAGNLLGAQQSGHITAIGFSLYCQLLRRSVAQLTGDFPPPPIEVDLRLDFISLSPAAPREPNSAAAIPYSYVDDEGLRLATYRRIASALSEAEIEDIRLELKDRFGPLPPDAERLLTLAHLRIAAANVDITKIETRGDKAMLSRGKDFVMTGGRHPRLTSRNADGRIAELLELIREEA